MQKLIPANGTRVYSPDEMQVGRNDPCPCGSGQKYKKCCGSVIALQAAGQRQCGTCTACCDGWLESTVLGYEMKPGQPCHWRGQGCCTIYEKRPQSPCRTFVCGWLAPNSPFPEEFRPDRLGVMMVRTRWRSAPAYILRSAGRDPDESLLAWMREFGARTGTPFFYEQRGERFGFGPPAFQQEMLARLESGEQFW